jgi:hypothetical protein
MATQEQIDAAERIKQRLATHSAPKDVDTTPTQRTRSLLQGVTFGGADELEAFFRSLGSEDYKTALNEIRGGLAAYKEARPGEALAFEVGGAAAPAILASLFTGGASLAALGARFPTLVNVAKTLGIAGAETAAGATVVGGIQGGLTGALSGESPEERLRGAIEGTLIGAPLALGVDKLAPIATEFVVGLVDIARRKLGNKAGAAVEKEVQRLAQEAGITPEQAVKELLEGRLLAENATLRDAVRSFRATGGPAATRLKEALEPRTKETRGAAVAELEQYLAGVQGENILKSQMAKLTSLKDEASELYNGPWAQQKVSPELSAELQKLFNRVPSAFDEVITAMKARGDEPFFKMVDGALVVTGEPTIAQAERVRRAIANRANKLWSEGQGDAGSAFTEVESTLRNMIDNVSDETRAARETYREMSNQSDAFDLGRKDMKATPDVDQVEINFDKVMAQGGEELKAYRTGIMSSLRRMLSSGSAASTIKKLLNEDNAQGQMLRTVFPEQNLEQMLQKLSVAKEANEAANQILGQSPTAITNEQIKRQGGEIGIMDLAEASSFNVFAITRLASNLLKKSKPELTDRQRLEVVNVLVSRDPQYVQSILKDETGLAKLQAALEKIANAAQAGTQRVVTQQAPAIPEKITGAFGAGPQ